MGANAVTTVPLYASGEVLTAADLNITNSGIPVFADSTARDNSFGGTGEKVLAEGQYAYLESTKQTLVYDGSNWVSVGTTPGLVLISSTTIGTTVASVTVSDAFSSTYDNYKIVVSGGVGSGNGNLNLTLGATATGYYYAGVLLAYNSATVNSDNAQNASSWVNAARASTNSINGNIELFGPNLAKNTHVQYASSRSDTTSSINLQNGYVANTTQYTAFTFTLTSGTITGGTISVYGYAK